MSPTVTDEELPALVQRVTDAAQALISGDSKRYAALIKHANDYTLMSPYGGDAVRGFDDSDAASRALPRPGPLQSIFVQGLLPHSSGRPG